MSTSLFAEAPFAARAFLRLRSFFTPYEFLASAFPAEGRILDLGSGHGLLALTLSTGSGGHEVIGIDHDPERVRLSEAAARKLPPSSRPRFEVGDLRESLGSFASGSLAGVAMIDILHYFDAATQQSLISDAARAIAPGGVLVMREIDADAGIKAAVNRLYERLATGVGFTRAAPNPDTTSRLSQPPAFARSMLSFGAELAFRGMREWTSLLEDAGFSVRSQPCGPPFLADVLFVGQRVL